ncbi:hypothetical protein [Pseudomonas sp. BN415]|uniref:hypothetical protein n=1 Tax=Pseudomonas sp. BN415 TaxID=2567889 RepID=UPI002454CB30|nr:hypothetical protein [Pseudomonas sp. BN415]
MTVLLGLDLILLGSGLETDIPLATGRLSIDGGARVLGAWNYTLRMTLPSLKLKFRSTR